MKCVAQPRQSVAVYMRVPLAPAPTLPGIKFSLPLGEG